MITINDHFKGFIDYSLVKSNVDEDEERGDDDSGGEGLVVVQRLLEEDGEREGAGEREGGEHGHREEEREEARGAALVELRSVRARPQRLQIQWKQKLNTRLQSEVDERAERGEHGEDEDDVVLLRAQPDPRQHHDDELQHEPGFEGNESGLSCIFVL